MLKNHKFYHDEKERRKWQNPEALLTDMGLNSGFTFVDIGCGDGFFALPAARIVGKNGKVYGLDINDEALVTLRKKAEIEGLKNIKLTKGEAEETVLCKICADIVFFGIDLHDFKDQNKVLINAKKMLKATGRLIDLDWKKEPMDLGPPLQIRFNEEEAKNLIKGVGFKIETVKEVGSYHYIIIAKL